MNLLTTLLMVGTHTLNLVTTITLHCACYRRTFNVIRKKVQTKNLPWEWISCYVRDGWHYFLAFFGQNSTARLSKWIIFNEEYYCDAVPTKIEASTSNSHKKMALQSSRPSDPGVCGLAFHYSHQCHQQCSSLILASFLFLLRLFFILKNLNQCINNSKSDFLNKFSVSSFRHLCHVTFV